MDSDLFELVMEVSARLSPCGYDQYPNAREIERENRKYGRLREAFVSKLSPEQKEGLENCLEAQLMWQATCERGAFALGYQTGARLMLAALAGKPA